MGGTRPNQYRQLINQVLNHIHQHLDGDLSLQALAQLASFSPFHFHRMFKAMMGETVNDYVKRIRVQKAAAKLIFSHLPVTEIALDCGFASVSTLSRAFKQHYGVSPSAYRQLYQERKNGKLESKNGNASPAAADYDDSVTAVNMAEKRSWSKMKVEVKTFPDYRVAYIRHLEGYDEGVFNEGIDQAFRRVGEWMHANDLFTRETLCLGIFYEYGDISPAEKRRYDAAFTVPKEMEQGSGEIGIQDLPGGKYAVIRVEVENMGDDSFAEAIRKMGEAFDYLYGEWLPNSPYQLEDKPCLEIYLTPPYAPVIMIDACLPVKPV